MKYRRNLVLSASLVSAAGLPMSVLAQEAPGGAPVVTPASVRAAPADETDIRFNFKAAPFKQVLEFFSRESGVPLIPEVDIPDGTMTFISADSFSFAEAMNILNLYLKRYNVAVRHEGKYLYLSSMKGAAQQPTPVVHGPVDESGLPSSRVITTTIPLNNANATLVAEQVKPLVAEYGSVLAVPAQNMLVLTESVAQCVRIQQIVGAIDSIRPVDSEFKLFPLKHAKADAVVEALKGLIGERVRREIIEKDGNIRKVEEVSVAGVNLQPDPRTNSVVAVGPKTRLETVESLIALLDVPEGAGGGRSMRTLTLETVKAGEAAQLLQNLFASVPQDRRPTVVPLERVSKITIVGTEEQIVQSTALLSASDPGLRASEGTAEVGSDPLESERDRRSTVVLLSHVTPASMEQLVRRLMSERQNALLRLAPTPDGRGLVVSGPGADVSALEQMVRGLDLPPRTARSVRQVTIGRGDPASVLARASALHEATGGAEEGRIEATLEPESRSVTLIGDTGALDRFAQLLRTAEEGVTITREARTYEPTVRRPSDLAARLQNLARALLEPTDGSVYLAPETEALDELGRLIVRALPEQFPVIEDLVSRLDGREPGMARTQVVRLDPSSAAGVLARARRWYEEQTAGLPPGEAGPIETELDAPTGSLVVRGSDGGVARFAELLAQARQLVPPDRVTRIVDVQQVDAAELLSKLESFLSSADPIETTRAVTPPSIRLLADTNALLVTAEATQHELIADYVRRLDRLEPTELPPLRLLQLKTADAQAIATMLSQQYLGRPQADRAARPVEVRADASTNTLIVAAHEELFENIRAFVDGLNKGSEEGPERVTELFPLTAAKAVDVAAAMDKLYPEPPMPMDRFNRPMPWAQEKKEVTVSAEPNSNALIIDAPADRMESLRELAAKLDRVGAPPTAELRTYRIPHADLSAIARTLEGLARQGKLSAVQPGRPQLQVTIETEPRSKTLIVAGDAFTFERVEQVLNDLRAMPVEKGLRIVPIANESAADVRARAMAIYEAQVSTIPDALPIEVTIDETSNSLLVVGDEEGERRFMQTIDALQRQSGPAREVRMIALRFAPVAEVVAFLEDLVTTSQTLNLRGGPPPRFEPIETTNALIVAAQPAQFAVIDALVRELDERRAGVRPPTRILRLRTTEAANIARVLQRSFDQRPVEEKSRQPVEIEADPATNTLIVSAHESALAEIKSIVEELNETLTIGEADREIRIFPLEHARAEELARTMDEMFPAPPPPIDRFGRPLMQLQEPKEVFVRADVQTNSLIVDAPSKRLAGFEQLVKSLDQRKPTGGIELRTYSVVRAELEAVAQAVREAARSGALHPEGQSAASAPVTVSVEPRSRTLVVSGPRDVFANVERILASVDAAPSTPPTGVLLVALKHARAERVRPLLEQVLMTRVREHQAQEGYAGDVQNLLDIAADPATNMLIISAPEPIQRLAEELIRTLDTEASAAGRSSVRVIPLTYAAASEVAGSITQAIPTLDLPSGGRPAVTPLSGSNALLLSGAEADLAKLQELIGRLDVRPYDPEKPAVETFALEHADARAIATTVERLLIEQQEKDPRVLQLQMRYARDLPGLFDKPQIRVEAEQRTNALIVSGPTQTIELARAIIERLDQPSPDPDRVAMTFTPARASPAALASTVSRVLTETLPTGRKPVEIAAEPTSGGIVVIGTQEQVAEAVRTLAQFDERALAVPEVQLSVFNLSHASATAVAGSVQEVLSDRTRWPEALRRVEASGVAVPMPRVNAEAESNRLLVSAPGVLSDLASRVVATLDAPREGGTVEVRVFRLTKGDATSASAAMSAALAAGRLPGERAPVVTPEPKSNSVVVAASPERIRQAAALVESMDSAVEPDGMGVRTVFLKHARADAIAPLVEGLLTKESAIQFLPPWEVRNFLRQGGSIDQGVRVMAERRMNAVVIAGPLATLDAAEQVVLSLDEDAGERASGERRSVRVIALPNADARELAATIEAVFAEDAAQVEPPTVRVDAGSNALIVRGSAEQLATIEALAKEVDSATISASRQLRMIPVDRSRAEAGVIAETLRRLMEQQGGVRVEVISVEDLLKRGEPSRGSEPGGTGRAPEPRRPGPSGMAPATDDGRTTRVAHARGGGVASMATFPVVAALGQPAGDEQADDRAAVTIAVDPVTNTLYVVGSPRLTDRLVELATALESQLPAEPTKVRIVNLPDSADARGLAQVIDQSARQIGRMSATNPGGFSGEVRVTPDPSGNALVVWANDTDFRTVGDLIAGLSSVQSSTALTVKIYPLSSVTASRAIESIQDLVSDSPRGRQAQRVRAAFDVTVLGPAGEVTARLDPALVRLASDPGGTSVLVAAPAEAIPLIDRFIEVLDQSPVKDRLSIRQYTLASAQAADVMRPLGELFEAQRQGPNASELPRARFVADERTNTLLVTASDAQHADVTRLLAALDADLSERDRALALEFIPVRNALPTTVQRMVETVVIGRDPARKERVQLSASDDSSVLIVRAPAAEMDEIRRIVAQVDSTEISSLPVRTLKLTRADAEQVARAIERFFQQRQQALGPRASRQQGQRIAVIGDRRSGALVVAANDDDYAQIESMVRTFDTSEPVPDMRVEIVRLERAHVQELETILRDLSDMLFEERMWSPWAWNNQGGQRPDRLFIQPHAATNSVLVMGQGTTFDTAMSIIKRLDVEPTAGTNKVVRAIPVESADLDAIARVVREAFTAEVRGRFFFMSGQSEVVAQVDRLRRLVILVGPEQKVERAAEFVRELARAGTVEGTTLKVIALTHADAQRAATTIGDVLSRRARSMGLREDALSVVGSRDGNVLIVSGREEEFPLVDDLVAQIDRDELGENRRIEVYYLANKDVREAAETVRAMFPRGRGGQDEQVVVTAQPSARMVIVSAPEEKLAEIEGLIRRLDDPREEGRRIVSVSLQNARAADVARALRSALPDTIKVEITPYDRNNVLLLTGSTEAIDVVMEQLTSLDQAAPKALVEFRAFKLDHAIADNLSFTLRTLLRSQARAAGEPEPSIDYSETENVIYVRATVDQLREIERMVSELDVKSDAPRSTEFVQLKYAPAEQIGEALKFFYGRTAFAADTPGARFVTIVPDPKTNSLVISAGPKEWEGIRALLDQLDTELYDTERQLKVIALTYADARSVAQALSEGFRSAIEQQLQRQQAQREQRGGGNQPRRDDGGVQPPVVLSDSETPSVSAEALTNSLIVFAGRRDMERIEAIVKELDLPSANKLRPAHLIVVESGRPSEVAQALRELFVLEGRGGRGTRDAVIVGYDSTGVVVVRADDREFAEIKALAEALQAEGASSRPQVRPIRLARASAVRLKATIDAAFQPVARTMGETLVVEVDRSTNALLVVSGDRLHAQIEALVRELDGAIPGGGGPGQSVLIIDIQNSTPDEVRQLLEQMGLTRPPPADRAGVLSEPITIVPLRTRRALAVVASPADAESITALVRALDAEPINAEQRVGIVALRTATASQVVRTLRQMLDQTAQTPQSPPAAALVEHLRRLRVMRGGINGDLTLDLTVPVRLFADDQTNAVIVSSSEGNVSAVSEIVSMLDTLPVGDAVVLRIFPLENASALQVKRVVDELFRQGEALRRLPGTQRQGLPPTATGRALAGEIAASVDERTNTLLVAGREEAVALVEVLVKDLDSERSAKWIEPTFVPLKHASPTLTAEVLREVLIEGIEPSPQAAGIQEQVGRLRVLREGGDPLQADIFTPLTSLSIVPEETLRGLIIVGSAANVAVVRELVTMLDLEAAAESNRVRVFPLRHAAADRVAQMASEMFRQREQTGATRPEDRLIITADVRTNALVVSTSPRSFAILEPLISTLDSDAASPMVEIRLVPVTGLDVVALGPKIERLMQERIRSAQQQGAPRSPSDAFRIEVDAVNDQLIVMASEENQRIVRELIDTMARGRETVRAERTEIVPLKSAGRAQEISQTINEVYVAREVAKRGEGAVSVRASARINALVVSGSPDDIDAVTKLAARFDEARADLEQQIKFIGLRSANAYEVVNVLETLLSGRSVTGLSPRSASQATRVTIWRQSLARDLEGQEGRPPTQAELDDAVRSLVSLTPDLRSNQVIVSAPPQVMELIEVMISWLDGDRSNREIETFRLVNADAQKMGLLLRDVFNLRQQGSMLVLVPADVPSSDDPSAPSDRTRTTMTAVPDERQQLSIAIDARTNTLVVSGTKEYLDRVRDLVTKLDAIEELERERIVVNLQNAAAKLLEETLARSFQEEQRLQQQFIDPDQGGSRTRQLEQEVTVVGDEKSNKLIITVSPRYKETVLGIISELDAAPPQVLIRVLLAEVTLDSSGSWGADFRLRNIGGDNFSIASLAAGAGIASTIGVPNLSFSSADFDLLVRALEAQGKLQVLSRPSVTVNNNEEAEIQVGDDIAIVTNVSRTDLRTDADVDRRELGIKLNVTPSINDDGFVRMHLEPAIQNLSAKTTEISADFQAPVINSRRLRTTVTVKDGQTVVIGGLIQTTEEHRQTKVPIIGDWPIIGGLFRSSQRSDVKTELLVILTPQVIYNDRAHGMDGVRAYRDISEHDINSISSPEAIRRALEESGAYQRPSRVGPNRPATPTGDEEKKDDGTPIGSADRPRAKSAFID